MGRPRAWQPGTRCQRPCEVLSIFGAPSLDASSEVFHAALGSLEELLSDARIDDVSPDLMKLQAASMRLESISDLKAQRTFQPC